MTITPARRSANHWPGLDVLPTGPRARVSARIARSLFEAAVNRLDVTVHVGDKTSRPWRTGDGRAAARTSSSPGSAATS